MKSTYLSKNTCSRLNVFYFHVLEGMWIECLEVGYCLHGIFLLLGEWSFCCWTQCFAVNLVIM